MPIYEYKCQQCGTHYEKRQNVSDPPLTTCEKCHGRLEKQWSLSGFQFKGGGWYVTDFRDKKKAVVEKSEAKTETKTDTTEKTKTETKTEDKT